MDKTLFTLEYIWLDGCKPVQNIRSKTRILPLAAPSIQLVDCPVWSFDGSSCAQATGMDSDCLLKPVSIYPDPLRGHNAYLVLSEVLTPEGHPHPSNTRTHLEHLLKKVGDTYKPWIGFEQEYTLFHHKRPLGWPEYGYPAPQGPYYCGVGSEQIFGRELAEEHAIACMDAGLLYYGMNAEVMPAQWEYQIGYRGDEDEAVDMLSVSDQAWVARWLLHRLSEHYGIHVSLENKPVKGDWNGAGMHTNFSTSGTRDPKTGRAAISSYLAALEKRHKDHIAVYGAGLNERLTGLHETCNINTFKSGTADRGASIRIPKQVAEKGYGYLEDRRPGANADPYLVAHRILKTLSDTTS